MLGRHSGSRAAAGLTLVLGGLLVTAAAMAGAAKPKTQLVDLIRFAIRYGFASPDVTGDVVTFTKPNTTLSFTMGSRKLFYNGVLIWLNGPLAKVGGKWLVYKQDEENVLRALLRGRARTSSAGADDRPVVVLDPGHGGQDPGATGTFGTLEKGAALDIAERVRTQLSGSGITVRMTRDRDKTVSLAQRARMANKLKGDLFVSIHLNSARDRATYGFETFVIASPGCPSTSGTVPDTRAYPGNSEEAASTLLGYYLQRALVMYGDGPDRGLKRERFKVLRDVECAAALVECGFLSNQKEEMKLGDREHRARLADAISAGILTYLHRSGETHVSLDSGPWKDTLDRSLAADNARIARAQWSERK